ncbi:MAG: GntR family transcriptional regulator [Candidatus Marinimicrobia bacterium]|nr:GntR family transcriptional regulator [Candidatus Neomarinimicrobiota bacterium]
MPIVKTTYKDQVVAYIYQLLLTDELRPGDQLKESLLAKEMGISRAPIREAMKELITNGLVDYRPQVGNFIPVLSPKQIVDSYTTRGVLEGYAVMESCDQFSAEEIDKLDNLVEQMESYAQKKKHKMVVEVGGEFHDLLISKNNNVQLLEYTDRLSLKLHVLFFKYWGKLYGPSEVGRRHREIVESLKSKDLAQIEKVIRHHYVETGSKIAAL